MRTMKKRKRAYYTGILAEPIEWAPRIVPPGKLPEPRGDWPLERAENYRLAIKLAGQEDRRNSLNQATGYWLRQVALWDHFGIDRSQPGWWRNVALSLGWRHEPDLVRGAGVAYAELFAMYGVDPDQPEADQLLALALAHRHVPGMRLEPRELPKRRLSTIDLVQFTLAVGAIAEHLEKTIGSRSDRKVAAMLVKPKLLKPILSVSEAAEVTRIIDSLGNRRQSKPGPLSERTLRGYLHQMGTALLRIREGRANPFQQQFVCEALPLIHQLGRTDTQQPGQI